MAKLHGVKINEALATHSMSVTEESWRKRRDIVLLGDATSNGFQADVSYGLLEMAEAKRPSTPAMDAMVVGLASRQTEQGSWQVPTISGRR